MIDAHGRGYMKQTIYFNLCATASTNSFSRKLANLQFRSFIFLSSSYPVLLAVCVVIFSSPATPKFDFLIDSLVGMSIDWLIDWCSDGCVGSNWEAKLISDLMRGYNRHARPTMNVSKPVDTTIAFYLTKILGLVSYEATHSDTFRGCIICFWKLCILANFALAHINTSKEVGRPCAGMYAAIRLRTGAHLLCGGKDAGAHQPTIAWSASRK